MEDNLKPEETYAPSIFEQASQMLGKESTNGIENNLFNSNPQTQVIEIDQETSEMLIEMPFEIASYLTKVNDVKLIETEKIKLGKLWRKPLERLLSQYPDSDIAIAAIATLAIAGEKYFEYKSELDRRNRIRNTGEGEDQLRKEQAT
jgi:hypothetical protein